MANSKLIAKNTIILYLRMLITMGINFYSSRVVLEQLGVEGYGVYNLVGGIVALVAFINSAMTSATQRFINYEKGTGNFERLRKVISASLVIHLTIALSIGIIAEILGPWILNEYLNIPETLLSQANVVYQFSVISFIIVIINVPYVALVIAHEKMSIFAATSVLESCLRLGSALILFCFLSNKLVYYGLFICITTIIGNGVYFLYCIRNFQVCRNLIWKIDKKIARSLVSFSGWSVVGSVGYILHTQGIAIVLNLFFSATLNATQGIANQVNGLVQSFISNFTIALNPQIVQSYASGEYEEMHKLIFRGCRLAIFLSAILVIPIIIGCKGLLNIWLTEIPPYTIGFVDVILMISLINSITSILSTAQNATGNIKKYQIVLTSMGLLHVPLVVIAFLLGLSPMWSVYVYLLITIALQIYRVNFVCKSIKMSERSFYRGIIFRSTFAIIAGLIIPIICICSFPDTVLHSITNAAIAFICVSISFIFIGLSISERTYLYQFIKSKFS